MSSEPTHFSSQRPAWSSLPATPTNTPRDYVVVSPRPMGSSSSSSLPNATFVSNVLDGVERAQSLDGSAGRKKKRSVSLKEVTGERTESERTLFSWQSLRSLRPFAPRAVEMPADVAPPPANQENVRWALTHIVCYLSNGDALKTEGLFRVSGNKTQIDFVADCLLKDPLSITTPHLSIDDACGVLKRLLRMMEFPTLFKLGLLQAVDKEQKDGAEAVKKELGMLNNTTQWIVLQTVMYYLAKVESQSSYNLMTSNNLAICFAPIFFHDLLDQCDSFEAVSLNQTSAKNAFLLLLSHYSSSLFQKKLDMLALVGERSYASENEEDLAAASAVVETNLPPPVDQSAPEQ